MLDLLRQAARYATYDRCRSWHSRYAPEECLKVSNVFDQIANVASWSAIISNQTALRRILLAPNGKEYSITYLPIALYTLRYWVVMQLAKQANGLWTARIGEERLTSCGRGSLFLGRTRKNEVVYHAWMEAQNSRFMLKMDISSFFDSISHEKLCEVISFLLGSDGPEYAQRAIDLLPSLLRYRYRMDGTQKVLICERGLPIGNTTERFFSNLYLSEIDEYLLSQPGVTSCRKLDDIRVYGDDRDQLQEIQSELEQRLIGLSLQVNQSKTQIRKRV